MKRASIGILLSVALVISMLSGILVMPAAAQEAVASVTVGDGDYNGDGSVDMYDYMAIVRYINGNTTLTAMQKQYLDVFADGVVDVYDALCMFRYINEDTSVLGGVVQSRNETYAQLRLEDAVYAQSLAVGDIVEMDLTVSALSDLVALDMHLSYDDKTLRFVEAEPMSANATPVSSLGGEVWLTKLWNEPVALTDGEVVATLRFEVLAPIMTSSAVSFSSVKAVSVQALDGLYSQVSSGESGSIVVEIPVTTTTAAQNYITYTIETVAHEGTIATGETVELDITASAVSDFNGMQLNLCFDDAQWEWVEASFGEALSSFANKTVNTTPLHPMTDKGEVWLTAMAMKGHTLKDGEVLATVKLRAKQDITADSVIGACYSQASSFDGTIQGYVPLSSWVDGGVKITKRTYTGPIGDYFYKNNVRLNAYQLVEHNGDFYFINNGNKLAKNTSVYLKENFVSGYTYADGTPLKVGQYDFDAEGKMIIKNGPVGDYFYKNNTMLRAYQLVEFEGNYYFIDNANKLAKNTSVYLKENFVSGYTYADGTPLKVGQYDFDAEGKMIIKNGPVGDYFYKNNTMLRAYQLVEFEGNYYFINNANKLSKSTSVHLNDTFVAGYTHADGTALKSGKYDFDADGKMIIRQGVVGDYFYRNGALQKAYQLVEFEGDYYFINDANKVAKNTSVYLTEKFTAEYGLAVGRYDFDADGKMIVKNGVVGDYFYLNGALQKAYQLVEFEGDYYFIDNANKVAKNTSVYLTEKFTAEYGLAVGRYDFDADGKMIVKNGVVGDYFYLNGALQKAYQLVEFEGNYYFINDANKVAKNTRIHLSERFTAEYGLAVGYYDFDADGKMIIKNGVVGDYFYLGNVQQKAYQLVKYNGDFYFISDGNKVVKNNRVYLSDKFVDGVFTDEGYPLFVGYYTFDEEGKLVY